MSHALCYADGVAGGLKKEPRLYSCPDYCQVCGTIIITRTTTGERYCPLCRA